MTSGRVYLNKRNKVSPDFFSNIQMSCFIAGAIIIPLAVLCKALLKEEYSARILLGLASNKVKHTRGVDKEWGEWAIAQSLILGTTITVSRLRRIGYMSMIDNYPKVKL